MPASDLQRRVGTRAVREPGSGHPGGGVRRIEWAPRRRWGPPRRIGGTVHSRQRSLQRCRPARSPTMPRSRPSSARVRPAEQPQSPFSAPARRRPLSRVPWDVVAVVSAGGVAGALARFAIASAWPHSAAGFPWATFVINVTGCLLIGVLMVAVTDVWPSRRLVRPFLGTGVLGGYTTFSTAIVETQHLLDRQAAAVAFGYLAGTAIAAL